MYGASFPDLSFKEKIGPRVQLCDRSVCLSLSVYDMYSWIIWWCYKKYGLQETVSKF